MIKSFPDEVQIIGGRHAEQVGQVNRRTFLKMPNARIEITQPKGVDQAQRLAVFFKDFFAGKLSLKPVDGGVAFYVSSYVRPQQTIAPTFELLPKLVGNHRPLIITPPKDYLGELDHRENRIGQVADADIDHMIAERDRKLAQAVRDGTRHLLRYNPQGENHIDVAARSRQLITDMQKDYDKGARIFIHIDHQYVEQVLATILTGRDISATNNEKPVGNTDLRLITTIPGSRIVVDHGYIYANGKFHNPGLTPYRDAEPGEGPRHYRLKQPLFQAKGGVHPDWTRVLEYA